MSELKSTVAAKPAAKAAAKPVEAKAAEAVVAPAKKETAAKKPAAAKKAPATKETVKKETTAKAGIKTNLYIQFSGKSYDQEELLRIAKDVWVYDLEKKLSDFKHIEMYVKPEESMVYYVINGKEAGCFSI